VIRNRCFTLALAALALPASAAAAAPLAATVIPSPGTARLQGRFALAGHVTVVDNVRGEHVGQNVGRIWVFTSTCPVGPCPTVTLVRARAGGQDTIALSRRAPGYYKGSGSFFAPLRCRGRTYAKGEAVPFTITVRVTAATVSAGVVIAAQVRAFYKNRSRINLTPCVAFPGHDAASYHGHLVVGAPPAADSVVSVRSPAGS
jgi:hypothetical protein